MGQCWTVGTEEAALGVGSCQDFSECSPAGVTGGNSNTSKVVLKMRRGSGEAVVEGKMERRHQALVTEWVSSLLRGLESGSMVAALIYIWFKAA